jgi:SpoVK/Ycf46/Vps4 family AAA+-type ATPase
LFTSDARYFQKGRLEVQIEIPLPDKEGRREILQIHFEALRRRGRLSAPLCNAIDGFGAKAEADGNASFRSRITAVVLRSSTGRIRDLAADSVTGGFSGADCSGLVRCAGSIALARARNQGMGGIDSLVITLDDVIQALDEVKK